MADAFMYMQTIDISRTISIAFIAITLAGINEKSFAITNPYC